MLVLFAVFNLRLLDLLLVCFGSKSSRFYYRVPCTTLNDNFLRIFTITSTFVTVILTRFYFGFFSWLRLWSCFGRLYWFLLFFILKRVWNYWVLFGNLSSDYLRLASGIYKNCVTKCNNWTTCFLVHICEGNANVESHSGLDYSLVWLVDHEGILFVVEPDSEAKILMHA